METNNSGIYIPHSSLDGLPVKISFIKIWDENNILQSLLDDQARNCEDKEHYLITCQLIINGQAVYQNKPFKTIRKNQIHEDHFLFPVSYKDLSYNAQFAFTIYSTSKSYNEQSPVGSTTFTLFDENLKLREGKYNLMIWPNVVPDTSYDSKTPGLVIDKNIENLNFCTQKIEHYESKQNNQEVTENLASSNLKLKLLYCYKTIPAAFIEISLPHFPQPVLFEDVEYQFDEMQLASTGGGYNMLMIYNPNQPPKQLQESQLSNRMFITKNTFSDCFVISDFDSELERSNPMHDMLLAVYREDANPETVKPNRSEIDLMTNAMKRPIIHDMKSDEKALFWRYRYYLLQFGAALPKFLHSVDWGSKKEDEEAMKLLMKWSAIEIEDAIYLLSSYTSSNELLGNKRSKRPIHCMIEVRNFAVKSLKRDFSDEKIETVLLQLVQALKYEPTDGSGKLSGFLIERAVMNKTLSILLYWYLHVEQDTNQRETRTLVTDWYKKIFDDFCYIVKQENPQNWEILQNQIVFRNKLQKLSSHIRTMRTDRAGKIAEIKKRLIEPEFQDPIELPEHPSCLNPNFTLLKAIPQSTLIFSSAMAPIRLCFQSRLADQSLYNFKFIFKNGDDLRQDQLVMQVFYLMDTLLKGVNQDMRLLPYKILACSKTDGFLEFVPDTITIQEILQTQTVSQYLKQMSEDSKNPFYIEQLPTQNRDLTNPENQQLITLLINEQVKKAPMGINPRIMHNYIMSSAGYCVLTYFLGIGDRHLENLLMNSEGKMFHIDFGFILGKDPKPYPPPFKLCKEMVEGMGGDKTEFYTTFKIKCVDVYLYLRKYAKLIISLFQLMSDAGIKDYTPFAIETMYEKFRLEDSDENAEKHFLGIVEESVKSLFPKVTDTIHKWASYWRK